MKKIFRLLLYILPFADALNGYMIRRYGFYGVGSLFHLVLLAFFVIWTLEGKRVRIGVYDKILCVMILSFGASLLVGNLVGTAPTQISIERTEKIIFTGFFITALYNTTRQNRITQAEFNKILEYQCVVIPLITLVADLTGIANHSYVTSGNGRIGFYTNLNETTIVFMIILTLLVEKLLHEIDFKHLVLFFATEVCIVLTESKSGVVAGILFVLTLVFFKLRKWLQRPKQSYMVASKRVFTMIMGCLPMGAYIVTKAYKSIYASFMRRQTGMYNAFGKQGLFAFLTSGRSSRLQTLLFRPLDNRFSKNEILGIATTLFGFGLSNDYYSTFEMDLFDCILYGGLIAGGCWIAFNYSILKKAKIVKTDKEMIMYILVIMVASVLVGHVWTGGVCGIYFALLVTKFTGFKKKSNEELIIK